MPIIQFFRKESPSPLTQIVVMAIIAGMSNSLILALVNASAVSVVSTELNIRLFLLFALAFALFLYSKQFALKRATVIVEQVLQKVRIRVADKVRQTELSFLEQCGQARIFTTLSQDTNIISESALVLMNAAASVIMVTISLFYIAYLSPAAFIITVGAIGTGVALFMAHRSQFLHDLQLSAAKETEFFERLGNVLNGFKQIKLNTQKSDEVFAALRNTAEDTKILKTRAGLKITTDYMFSQVFYYTLLGTIIFVLPWFDKVDPDLVVQLTSSILFIIGPLDMVVGALPMVGRAGIAVGNLEKLETELDAATRSSLVAQSASAPVSFHEIRLGEVGFRYAGEEGQSLFCVGPLDLTIRRGEILYIVGGNGSGKSTLMKLLTGLYYPQEGSVLVDGKPLQRDQYQQYREQFSIIFTDFHLFDRCYGVNNIDSTRVYELLKVMGLDQKTTYHEGRFTNIALSTGQRKRLALVMAFMEDKDVYVFDEWAADQDPEFKHYFYEELLPGLKARGKTVVAVTHDDRYFGCADRVIKMEFGRIV
jgi:putative pyoverdin transport system ATP-binding/permease protein